MCKQYRILYEGGEAEFVEKKSRFLATVCPVQTEEEALEFIESLKKKILECHSQLLGLRPR